MLIWVMLGGRSGLGEISLIVALIPLINCPRLAVVGWRVSGLNHNLHMHLHLFGRENVNFFQYIVSFLVGNRLFRIRSLGGSQYPLPNPPSAPTKRDKEARVSIFFFLRPSFSVAAMMNDDQ